MHYAIVSDGCGGSKGSTDVGSRVVAHCTKRAIVESFITDVSLGRDIFMERSKSLLGLCSHDMLATSCYLTASTKSWTCSITGDGVYAAKHTDGSLIMTQLSWSKNTPFYPEYTGVLLEDFKSTHNNIKRPLTAETWKIEIGSRPELYNIDYLPIDQTLAAGYVYYTLGDDIQAMGVFTDGITDIDGMDWKDAVIQAMSFKTTKGNFLKRRMGRIIRDSLKTGRGPLDDIAGAVIIRE